jgi:hypothetical protein
MEVKTLAFAALLMPLAGQAASLQAYTSAGDSAAVVATCLFGSYPYGSDLRGCSDDSGMVNGANASTKAASDSWATYASSAYSRASAAAQLGTLRASAQTFIPAGDNVGHNLQSHATADMQDTLLAGPSSGSFVSGYNYSVVITGFATPSTPSYTVPSIRSDVYVQLNIRVAATGEVLVGKYWETTDLQLGNGLISGSFGGVAPNTPLSLEVFIDADSYVTTASGGAGGYAEANYASTVHFYLDAATPGANTVGGSGYDYATAAAVPEPASLWTLALGLGFLAWRRRGR